MSKSTRTWRKFLRATIPLITISTLLSGCCRHGSGAVKVETVPVERVVYRQGPACLKIEPPKVGDKPGDLPALPRPTRIGDPADPNRLYGLTPKQWRTLLYILWKKDNWEAAAWARCQVANLREAARDLAEPSEP